MKILKLQAENVKRLKAVEITPTGAGVQVIGGENGAGKSSVIDAIFYALAGKTAQANTPNPIREGADKAHVTLDLGDLKVTRRWTGKTDTLTVENADGARYTGPQKILDELMGKITFDPLAFTRMNAVDQQDLLLSLVDLPFDLKAHDQQAANVFAERRALAPQIKAAGTPHPVNETMPQQETDLATAMEQVQAAQRVADVRAEEARAIETQTRIVADLRANLTAAEAHLAETTARFQTLPPAPDMEKARAWLGGLEAQNRSIRENNNMRTANAHIAALTEKRAELTAKLESMAAAKTAALAGARFPLEGVSFGEHGVTYKGQPLTQASSAEQIAISAAIGMALDPELKVMRIMDGSLLDAASMAALERMAVERDYQIWVERVGDADAGAVIIEDGEVKK